MIHIYIEVFIFCNKGCFNLNVKFRDILLILHIGNTQKPLLWVIYYDGVYVDIHLIFNIASVVLFSLNLSM